MQLPCIYTCSCCASTHSDAIYLHMQLLRIYTCTCCVSTYALAVPLSYHLQCPPSPGQPASCVMLHREREKEGRHCPYFATCTHGLLHPFCAPVRTSQHTHTHIHTTLNTHTCHPSSILTPSPSSLLPSISASVLASASATARGLAPAIGHVMEFKESIMPIGSYFCFACKRVSIRLWLGTCNQPHNVL